ncbi:MAG: glucosamine-6-phosphate deaminase, partial [Fusobacteriales bacterium]
VGTIMDAKEVLIMVSGHSKSRALYQGVECGVNHLWTISALQLHEKGIIVADEEACSELKVGIYRYYKDIEKKNLDTKKMIEELYK